MTYRTSLFQKLLLESSKLIKCKFPYYTSNVLNLSDAPLLNSGFRRKLSSILDLQQKSGQLDKGDAAAF